MSTTLTGLDELRASIKAVLKLEPLRDEVLVPAAKLGQSVAKGKAGYPNIARSITRRTTSLTARITAKSNPLAHLVEGGRRPGAKAPPISSIRYPSWAAFAVWADSQGATTHNRMFLLAQAIARRGIKGRFFMRAGREAVADALPGLNANCARALERIWGNHG